MALQKKSQKLYTVIKMLEVLPFQEKCLLLQFNNTKYGKCKN